MRASFGPVSGQARFRSAAAAVIAVATLLCTAGTASALPEGMSYEMVTPVHKNGLDAGTGGFAGNYRASADGNSLLYQALGAWGDAPNYAIGGVYMAKRGERSWSSYSAMLPTFPGPLFNGSGVPAYARDFSKVIAVSNMNLETGGETHSNAYLLDPVSKHLERITPDAIPPLPSVVNLGGTADYAFNDDLSTVFFASTMKLTNDTLTGWTGDVSRLYRYSDGEVTLASRLPTGEAVNGTLPLFGDGYGGGTVNQQPTNVLSDDANVVYFRSQGPSSFSLYRRDYSGPSPRTDLVNVNESSVVVPAPGDTANAYFAGASADGQIAYFTSRQGLVDDDTDSTADIYRYDYSRPEGSRLTLVSADDEPGDAPSGTGNSYGVSDDGKTIFFSSDSQLVAGETTAPGAKLFAYHDGELRFVALTGDPVALIESGGPDDGTADTAWSDNDKYFGFITKGTGITPEDNGGTLQAYRYEIATDEIVCVSCLGAGKANTMPASWRRNVGVSQLAFRWTPIRNIADDGTVFFQTAEALTGSDTNGKVDVYAWRDGEADLISTGRSIEDSWMMDANSDGSSVFFLTRSQLVEWDNDDLYDVYAARVGGGLPEPSRSQEPPCDGDDCIPLPTETKEGSHCIGDDCRAALTSPPALPSVGSLSFIGDGNVSSASGANPSVGVKRLKAVTGPAARLRVRVPAGGRILVSGPQVRRTARSASRAGTYSVRIALNPRARKSLRRKKTLRVSARVSYRAKDGRSASKTVKVAFKQPKSKRAKKTRKGGR